MRKPRRTEKSIQSRDMEENQTGNPNRNKAESPNPTKKPKRYNIIPPIIALCVILATNRTAPAQAMSFNPNSGLVRITKVTLTLPYNGMVPYRGPEENYVVDKRSGTDAGQTITGQDSRGDITPENHNEQEQWKLMTDPAGSEFDGTNIPGHNTITMPMETTIAEQPLGEFQNFSARDAGGGDVDGTNSAGPYTNTMPIMHMHAEQPLDEYDNFSERDAGAITRITASESTSTPVPFQAPLADAIPVIGSVLVLGALRKVRNFKKA